jgi:hypothetical protein
MLRFGVPPLLACTLVLAGGVAHAAQPSQARFKVTLTATLTKSWTFTRVEDSEPECTRTTRGVGRWEARVSTRRAGRARATAASGGRVRFSGALLRTIFGTAKLSGTMTFAARGDPPCERVTRSVRCTVQRRSFRNAYAVFGSPRRGVLRVGPLRGAGAFRSFAGQCPEEPPDIRSIRTDLRLANGPLSTADVFARDVPRFFVSGNSQQVTTLTGALNGRVTEQVRWTLNFTRI